MEKNQGTGDRGQGPAVLDAPKAVTAAPAPLKLPAGKLEQIPLAELRPSPTNPRTHFDEAKIKEYAESYAVVGQLQPIVGRRVAGKPGVEIICGETRWRAAKLAQLPHLDVMIREMSDADALKAQLIENVKRGDITPLEEARGIQNLMKMSKLDVKSVSAELKMEPRSVYGRLQLLKLPDFILKELEAGVITAKHAELIGALPTDEIRKLAMKECVHETQIQNSEAKSYNDRCIKVAISVRDLQAYIARELYRELRAAPWDLNDPKLGGCMGLKATACSVCPKRSSANPLLYPDQATDMCLDERCFEGKMVAHIDLKRDAGMQAIGTSNYYYGADSKGVVASGKWAISKRDDAVDAIFIDGPRRGQVVKVDIEKAPASSKPAKPKPAAPAASASKEEKAKAAEAHQKWLNEERKRKEKEELDRKRAAEKRDDELEIGNRTLKAICAKVKSIGTIELELIAADTMNAYGSGDLVHEIMGWKNEPARTEKAIAALSDADKAKLIVALLLHEEVGGFSSKRLDEAAKRYKVDQDAIEKQVKADRKAKADAEAAEKKDSGKVSGKQIAADVAAAKKSKTPKAKKK